MDPDASWGRCYCGPWEAVPVIAAGPYRRVRNPIYLAALLIVLGVAWLRWLSYGPAAAGGW